MDEPTGPVTASNWESVPAAVKACRELGHAWPANLALEFFHVERQASGRGKGKAIGLERRLPCTRECGCIKVTPYLLERGWPVRDVTRKPTIKYPSSGYLLKREFEGQDLPSRGDWGDSRLREVPGLTDYILAA